MKFPVSPTVLALAAPLITAVDGNILHDGKMNDIHFSNSLEERRFLVDFSRIGSGHCRDASNNEYETISRNVGSLELCKDRCNSFDTTHLVGLTFTDGNWCWCHYEDGMCPSSECGNSAPTGVGPIDGSYSGDGGCYATVGYVSKILTPAPTPAPTLSISSRHFISLADNSTDIAFNEDRAPNEIKFGLNVTNYDILEGHLNSSIKVFAGLHCNGTKLESDVLSVTANLTRAVLNEDGIYAVVPVDIDVNTKYIANTSAPYVDYFTLEDEKVTMKFCVMPELGAVDIDVGGISETSSISYTKINFVVEIDMKKGFQSASATVTEDAPEENNQSTQIDYGLNACECDENQECIDVPQEKTQNSAISICVYTDSSNTDIVIKGIKDMKIEDTSASISYDAITENMANSITDVTSEGTKNVMVTTRLISVFFSGLASSGGTSTLDITGTAVLEFATGSRRLVSIRQGGLSKKNKGSSNLSMRKLEDDVADEGEFETTIVVLTGSLRSGGSSIMMKTVAQAIMLGAAGVALV